MSDDNTQSSDALIDSMIGAENDTTETDTTDTDTDTNTDVTDSNTSFLFDTDENDENDDNNENQEDISADFNWDQEVTLDDGSKISVKSMKGAYQQLQIAQDTLNNLLDTTHPALKEFEDKPINEALVLQGNLDEMERQSRYLAAKGLSDKNTAEIKAAIEANNEALKAVNDERQEKYISEQHELLMERVPELKNEKNLQAAGAKIAKYFVDGLGMDENELRQSTQFMSNAKFYEMALYAQSAWAARQNVKSHADKNSNQNTSAPLKSQGNNSAIDYSGKTSEQIVDAMLANR